MKPERTRPTHCSDDDLIALLYSGELDGTHAADCLTCQHRLSELQANRDQIEREQLPTVDVDFDRLAAQRRHVYARLSQPVRFWSKILAPRWISAGATALVLGGGLLVFQQQQHVAKIEDKISDVDLAQEVSQLSQSAETMPTEPLKGLFE